MKANVIALLKTDGQRFVFLYDDRSHDALLRQFGRMASDEGSAFSWYDAATLTQRARRMRSEREKAACS